MSNTINDIPKDLYFEIKVSNKDTIYVCNPKYRCNGSIQGKTWAFRNELLLLNDNDIEIFNDILKRGII